MKNLKKDEEILNYQAAEMQKQNAIATLYGGGAAAKVTGKTMAEPRIQAP